MLSSMKLSQTTLMGKEEAKKIRTIIQSLLDKPESYDFQNPVDWKGKTSLTFSSWTHWLHFYHQESYGSWDLQWKAKGLEVSIRRVGIRRFAIDLGQLQNLQPTWDSTKTLIKWIYKTA